jgi:hypothetical protein
MAQEIFGDPPIPSPSDYARELRPEYGASASTATRFDSFLAEFSTKTWTASNTGNLLKDVVKLQF